MNHHQSSPWRIKMIRTNITIPLAQLVQALLVAVIVQTVQCSLVRSDRGQGTLNLQAPWNALCGPAPKGLRGRAKQQFLLGPSLAVASLPLLVRRHARRLRARAAGALAAAMPRKTLCGQQHVPSRKTAATVEAANLAVRVRGTMGATSTLPAM